MAKNLKAILSKKNWSGEEVGRALIANLMNDIKCIGKDHEPLFSQGELDTMTNSLSEEQYNNLRPYHRLHSIIHESYNFLQAKHQQFYNGYYRLLNYLKSAEAIEAMRTQAEKYPLILSAEKYDELSRIAYEERRGTVDNLYGAIISHLSQAFLDYLDGDEHLPEEYRVAFEKLKQETATDAAIIKQSDEVSPRGTYVLPTGERSRDYTREEWYELQREAFKQAHGIESEEDLAAFGERCIVKGRKAYFRGKAYTIRQMKREGIDTASVERESEKEVKSLLYIITDNEVRRGAVPVPEPSTAAGAIYRYVYGADSPIKWEKDKSKPSKYQVLYSAVKDRLSYVERLDNGYSEVYGKDDVTASLHFARDYYETMTVAWEEIKGRVSLLFEGELDSYDAICAAIESGESDSLMMLKGAATAEDLRDAGVYGYHNFLVDANVFDIYHHIVGSDQPSVKRHELEYSILFNGLAILQKNSGLFNGSTEKHVENGIFFPADLINDEDSIEKLWENEETKAELKHIQKNLIDEALRYLYAYNAFIGVLEEVYELDLTEAKANMTDIEKKIKKVRNLLYYLYMDATGNNDERAAKQKLIKALFDDADISDYKPDKERIEHTISKYRAQATYKEKLDNLRSYESDILYLAEKGETYE